MTSEVTDHVRDRVEAMKDRAKDKASSRGAGDLTGTGGSRLESIRETQHRGGGASRGADLERLRANRGEESLATRSDPNVRNRAESVLAARGTSGFSRDTAVSISDRRSSESLRRPAQGGRADAVLAAREAGPRSSASGGAMVRTRTQETEDKAKKPAKGEKAAATELPTEEDVKAQAAKARRRKPARPNPVPLIAAAAVVVLLLAGLIYFLVTSGGEDSAERMAGSGQGTSEQGTSAGAQPGTTQGQAAVAPPPPPPPRIQATHIVRRGDSLWRISREQYSDPLNWPSIFMENQDQIRNPDLIHPAQEFRIPSKPEYRFPDYPKGYSPTR